MSGEEQRNVGRQGFWKPRNFCNFVTHKLKTK